MTKYIKTNEALVHKDKDNTDSITIQVDMSGTTNPAEQVQKLVESILNEAENNNKIDIVSRNLGDRGPKQESVYPVIYIKNSQGMSALKVMFFFRISTHPDSENFAGRNRFNETKKDHLSKLPDNQKSEQGMKYIPMIVDYDNYHGYRRPKAEDILYATYEDAELGIRQYIDSLVHKYRNYDGNLFYGGYNIKKVGKSDWIIVDSEGNKISKHFYNLDDIKVGIDTNSITASQSASTPITDLPAKQILAEVRNYFKDIVPYRFYIVDVFQELTVDDIYLELRDSAGNSYEGFIPIDEYVSGNLDMVIADIIDGFTETYNLYGVL